MLTNHWKFERVDSLSTKADSTLEDSGVEQPDTALVYFSWLGRIEEFKEDLHKLLGKGRATKLDCILTDVIDNVEKAFNLSSKCKPQVKPKPRPLVESRPVLKPLFPSNFIKSNGKSSPPPPPPPPSFFKIKLIPVECNQIDEKLWTQTVSDFEDDHFEQLSFKRKSSR